MMVWAGCCWCSAVWCGWGGSRSSRSGGRSPGRSPWGRASVVVAGGMESMRGVVGRALAGWLGGAGRPLVGRQGRTGVDVLGCEGLESMRGGVSHSRSGVLSSRCGCVEVGIREASADSRKAVSINKYEGRRRSRRPWMNEIHWCAVTIEIGCSTTEVGCIIKT